MFKRFSFLLLLPILIPGCILDKDEDSQALEGLYGTWRFDGNTSESFLHITKDYNEFFDHHEPHDCYTTRRNPFVNTNDRRLTFETYDGNPQFIDWVIQGDKLTFDSSEGISNNLTRSADNPESIVFCSDSTDQGLINVSINFQELPQALHFEEYYNLQLLFDLNENDVEDTGDISFLFYKSRESDITNMSSLFAYSRMFLSRSDEYNINISHLSTFQYAIENNSFHFQIKKSDHLAFSDITAGASIQVIAHYGNDNEIYQTDYYPSYNDSTPPGTDLSNMIDNSDDTYGDSSEPIIIDLEEISIQFIE